jgi:hypothetical protein
MARANVLALESAEAVSELRAYNVASAEPHTIEEMAIAPAKAATVWHCRNCPTPRT